MNDSVKHALRNALKDSLQLIRPLECTHAEPYLVWRRQGKSWQGAYEDRPSLRAMFASLNEGLSVIGASLMSILRSAYPELSGVVGYRGFMTSRLGDTFIVSDAMCELYRRHGTFTCNDGQLEVLVTDVERFLDSSRVEFRCWTELRNFRMDSNGLELTDDLAIRRLTDSELAEIHGQYFLDPPTCGRWLHGPRDEFILERRVELLKATCPGECGDGTTLEECRAALDRAVLALRTFMPGMIGYDLIHFSPTGFSPISVPSMFFTTSFVPFGKYDVPTSEVESLQRHARLVLMERDGAMEMACSRLADAETRLRAQDKLIDAVIGLEALLLAGIRGEDRRGELKYRFAIHYASLFAEAESRHSAFRVAKDLYDARSSIAHGSSDKNDMHRVGDRRATLDEAAQIACHALREVVHRFLPDQGKPYRNPEFWERAYFGLDAPTG